MTARQWVRVLDTFLDDIGNSDYGQPVWLQQVVTALNRALNVEARYEPIEQPTDK